MKIGYFQYNPYYHNIPKNLDYIQSRLGSVSADLIVLPELSLSGYLFNSNDEVLACAETIPGPSTDKFLSLAKKTQTAYIYGCIEKDTHSASIDDGSPKCYNSSVFINPQGEIKTYRKAHLFNREKIHFIQGDDPFFVFDIQGISVGMLICFDHMFPEAARTLTLMGAQIICHPSNLVLSGFAQATTLARSIENQIFWVLANRIGTENSGSVSCTYTGGSQISTPDGSVIVSSSQEMEDLQIVDIDPSLAINKSISKRNHIINDRRTDLYQL
jgi:5-aminopentanamidase